MWAQKLANQCRRYAPKHRFVCLSDIMFKCDFDIVPLVEGWPGWWSKIECFRPNLFTGPVVYFDLDTLIVGDLTDLCSYQGKFACLRDFYRSYGLGSGVMAWNPCDETDEIFEQYAENPRDIPGGDQAWIERVFPKADRLQDIYSGIYSYKVHHCGNIIPGEAKVVCLHGRPKFADMRESDPVRQTWEAA
jgi:hypothetical protein